MSSPTATWTADHTPRKLNRPLLRSAIIAAIGGLLFGFDTVVISGTTQAAREVFALPGWILSSASTLGRWFGTLDPREVMVGVYVFSGLVGTIIGAAAAGIPGDKLGRRASLRWLSVLYLGSSLGCAFAWNWSALLAFRVIAGLGIGGSSVLGPMYIAEISPAKWRGRLVGLFQFNIVTGILVAYLSNYLVGLAGFGGQEWRVKLGVAAIPAFVFFALLFTIPESPRWLVKRKRTDEARAVLQLTGEQNYEQELQEIVQSIYEEHQKADEPLFRWKYRFPIFLAVTIGLFNQLSGINALLYYANDIFRAAGFTKTSGDVGAVIIGLTNFALTIVALSVIDRLGRKKLLLIGAAGTAACLATTAAIFFNRLTPSLLLPILVAFIGFFAFSQGAVIWVYLSEVFPNRVRAKGQSLGSFSHWFMNAIISLVFPIMAARSRAYPFVFFAVMTAVQFFVVLFTYPETKGASLEELQHRMGIV